MSFVAERWVCVEGCLLVIEKNLKSVTEDVKCLKATIEEEC
jgi:hypothetical protein